MTREPSTVTDSPGHAAERRAPNLEFCFDLFVQIGAPIDLGQTHQGHRRIIPIVGGHFEGPRLNGQVLPGGADWQIIHPDGVVAVDTRYTLQTSEGLVFISNRGIRYATPEVTSRMTRGERVEPHEYYFRTNPTFETSAPDLQWLTHSVFLGIATRNPLNVHVEVWRVV